MIPILKDSKLILAFISSPIFAVYGLLPVYLFNTVDFGSLLKGFTFLTSLFLIMWFIDLLLLKKFKNDLSGFFFASSYISILFLLFLSYSFAERFLKTPQLNVNFLYPLFSVLVMNSIILLIINTIEINSKRKMELLEIEKTKTLQIETQHRLLLNHLQPHILFNMLSTLKSVINNNPKEAADFTVKLSNFLRNSLHSDTSGLHTLEQELNIVEDFFHLQKSRFGNSFVYEINIPQHYLNSQIPSLSIQILVENAFKHNLFSTYNPLEICIGVINYNLFVKNNFTPNDNQTNSGTGLKNLNERCKILLQKKIQVSNKSGKFEVIVPIKSAI